jgi:hypothetical protein
MPTTTRLTDRRSSPLEAITPGKGSGQTAVRPHQRPRAANASRHQLDPVTIGFWLGGVVLGIGGCILGASMLCHHPVGVTIGVLWWGIYVGCFGASLGALAGKWTSWTRASRCLGPDGAGKPGAGGQSP